MRASALTWIAPALLLVAGGVHAQKRTPTFPQGILASNDLRDSVAERKEIEGVMEDAGQALVVTRLGQVMWTPRLRPEHDCSQLTGAWGPMQNSDSVTYNLAPLAISVGETGLFATEVGSLEGQSTIGTVPRNKPLGHYLRMWERRKDQWTVVLVCIASPPATLIWSDRSTLRCLYVPCASGLVKSLGGEFALLLET